VLGSLQTFSLYSRCAEGAVDRAVDRCAEGAVDRAVDRCAEGAVDSQWSNVGTNSRLDDLVTCPSSELSSVDMLTCHDYIES
jgi:hypothetical protein